MVGVELELEEGYALKDDVIMTNFQSRSNNDDRRSSEGLHKNKVYWEEKLRFKTLT